MMLSRRSMARAGIVFSVVIATSDLGAAGQARRSPSLEREVTRPVGIPSKSETFVDRTDDQNGLAPDITTVTVTNDASGRITFEIHIRNYNAIRPRISFVTLVDADRDPKSGTLFGGEYAVNAGYYEADKYAAAVGRWNGTNFDFSRPSSYSASFTPDGAGGRLRLEIDQKDLGNTSGFNFRVGAYWFISHPQIYDGDHGPDSGSWSYTLAQPPSAGDRDRDGIADARDKCPRASAVFDFNRNGCTGPFRRMQPDLKFRALGYSSYVTMVSARIEDLPPAAQVEIRCRNACRVRQRQQTRAPVIVLTDLNGQRLTRGAVVEILVTRPGWIGYYARIDVRGAPPRPYTTESCIPAIGKRAPMPCSRVDRGK
jgi:hypothetical protein